MKTIILIFAMYILLLSVTRTNREAVALDTPKRVQLKYPVSQEYKPFTHISDSRSDRVSQPCVQE
jgi:hypothetical protein